MSVTTGGTLSGTATLSADTTSTALHLPVSTQLPPTFVKQEPTSVSQGNIKLRELCVKVKRLTESDIAKDTTRRKTLAKPLKLVLHKLPLVPTQSVDVASPKTSSEPKLHSPTRSHISRKEKDKVVQTKQPNLEWKKTVPKCKISGHPSGDKHHTFQVKCHILRKRIRKLYLKCRITNCKQAFQSFHSVKELNILHRIFHAKTVFKYQICSKKHCTPSSAHYHRYEHQRLAFTCSTCKKSVVLSSKLQQHRRVHIQQKLYHCFYDGCTKHYKHPQDLNRHTASHFSKKLECLLCDYSSNQKRLLKCHSAEHQNILHYTCKKCGAGFKHHNQIYRQGQNC